MGILCIFLSVACVYDYREHRIPNWLIAGIGIWGVLLSYARQDGKAFLFYLVTGSVVLAVGYLFFRSGGLGAGDVKLFAVTAGYLSIDKIFCFIFYSMLIAAIISLFGFIRKRNPSGKTGVCLSGPILISVLLSMGGVY